MKLNLALYLKSNFQRRIKGENQRRIKGEKKEKERKGETPLCSFINDIFIDILQVSLQMLSGHGVLCF